jgi:hypothetical protein
MPYGLAAQQRDDNVSALIGFFTELRAVRARDALQDLGSQGEVLAWYAISGVMHAASPTWSARSAIGFPSGGTHDAPNFISTLC